MSWISFANPWLLTALTAVGLPVLIHFLTRARPRRISFPPFKFLVEACAGQQAMHRLRTFVLLSLRTLAVLALVLLFTRPFLRPKLAGTSAEANRRAVLIVDASLSMRAVQHGVSLFGRAQAEAAEVLRNLEAGSDAAVILAGATPRPLLPVLSRNLPALHNELIRATATFEKGDPAAALALAARLLAGPGTIHVFSDFQNANWEPVQELPAGVACRLRPVTRGPVENVALLSIAVEPAEPVADEPAEVVCTVFNGTSRARQETIRLEFADSFQETRVTVLPFSKADASFNVRFPQAGVTTGRATLVPDDLPEDNTRHLSVQVTKALQLLLMSDAEVTDSRSAAFFLSRALAPSTNGALSIARRHSQDADRGILETADVFVLAPPAMLSGEALEIIERRVRDGARFLAFLDGPTSPLLVPASFSPPFQLLPAVTSDTGEGLVPTARKFFADAEAGDLGSLRFRRHHRNRVLTGRESDVLLAYADGSAGLTVSAVGRGFAGFANFPLTPDAGDFIGHPMFPVTLHELLRTMRRGASDREVTPGAAWTKDVPTSGDAPVTVADPDGKPLPVQILSSGRMTRLAMAPAGAPGIIRMQQGNRLVGATAINPDPLESDTRPIALENLRTKDGGSITMVRDELELSLTGQTRPLWPHLAAAAALFLALEMLLLSFWQATARKGQTSSRARTGVGGGRLRRAPEEAVPEGVAR
jgi:Aerotolerance regulator N-terminal/von Willebrand factor type A domain